MVCFQNKIVQLTCISCTLVLWPNTPRRLFFTHVSSPWRYLLYVWCVLSFQIWFGSTKTVCSLRKRLRWLWLRQAMPRSTRRWPVSTGTHWRPARKYRSSAHTSLSVRGGIWWICILVDAIMICVTFTLTKWDKSSDITIESCLIRMNVCFTLFYFYVKFKTFRLLLTVNWISPLAIEQFSKKWHGSSYRSMSLWQVTFEALNDGEFLSWHWRPTLNIRDIECVQFVPNQQLLPKLKTVSVILMYGHQVHSILQFC